MIHLAEGAERKSKNAYDWLAASRDTQGEQAYGSIVFYAFPQELVNMIAERTGGRPVTVAILIWLTGTYTSTKTATFTSSIRSATAGRDHREGNLPSCK